MRKRKFDTHTDIIFCRDYIVKKKFIKYLTKIFYKDELLREKGEGESEE